MRRKRKNLNRLKRKMIDPTLALTTTIDKAAKVSNTPFFKTIIDKILGFRISQWAAEGEVRKKAIHDEYEKAKREGIMGVAYIKALRDTTNLIDTAVRSTKYINPNKTNDIKIDNDFFWNTLEHSKSVSNEEMQELIAKIIAGEYNSPGSYSMNTLQTIKILGKNELEIFERISSTLINVDTIPIQIFNLSTKSIELMKELNTNFLQLQTLQSLGLFLPNEMFWKTENPVKINYMLKYFEKEIVFEPTHENNFTVALPQFFGLSITGKEIIKHLNPKFNEKYYLWLKENYKIPNYKVVEENKN